MPELPEVLRATRRLLTLAKGKRITRVLANEDSIVYMGTTSAEFASSVEGKKVLDVRRKGKNFYLLLSSGPHPVFHFGMSGTACVRGEAGDTYRAPRAKTDPAVWPPKYTKAVLTFAEDSPDAVEVGEWAFCDARRLGRIKLVHGDDPHLVPPLSLLGADPFLDMPTVEDLSTALLKRKAPIKAVLLDQYGPLCGIGNWMVDEILYQAKLHPAHPAHLLTPAELSAVHTQVRHVTVTAADANAESSLFPSDWLFSARWSRGKKGGKTFTLPDGREVKIAFMTVGGRTSAVVEEVQILPREIMDQISLKKTKSKSRKRKAAESSDELTPLESTDDHLAVEAALVKATSPYFNRVVQREPEPDSTTIPSSGVFHLPESLVSPIKARRSSKRRL